MKQDLLTHLPPDITNEILSRLPIPSIIRCRCVRKSWLNLIKTNEFVNSHLSKSVPGLALFQTKFHHGSKPYKVVEFVENSMHIVFNSRFPHDHHKHIHSSVNGLLLLLNLNTWPPILNIYNPITRDYIKLPRPHDCPSGQFQADTFGFGVSKKSGQYKVVRLFHECIPRESYYHWKTDDSEAKCEVYTLGTGSWRIINEPNVPLSYNCDYRTTAMFLNGNLHWQGRLFNDGSMWISCFDLEAEVFTIFSAPHIDSCHSAISTLEECLVVCDTTYYAHRMEIVIWFMNEYGDDKSWTKKFIITKTRSPDDYLLRAVRPIKVFEDGDILIADGLRSRILCYSSKAKTIEETALAESYGFDCIGSVSYTPSFVPLNTFTMENYAVLEHGEARGEVRKVCEATSSEKV